MISNSPMSLEQLEINWNKFKDPRHCWYFNEEYPGYIKLLTNSTKILYCNHYMSPGYNYRLLITGEYNEI